MNFPFVLIRCCQIFISNIPLSLQEKYGMSDYTVNVAASQNGFSADAIAASSEDETENEDQAQKRLVLFSQKLDANMCCYFPDLKALKLE